MSRPRIVFFGTPAFAVPSLLACLEQGEVVAVVTQPDKGQGRGQGLKPSPVKEAALARGLTVLQPQKLRTPPFHEVLGPLGADLNVVTAYGKILPKEVLAAARLGSVNVHGSLLPRWRGAAPIQRALLAGDLQTGVCLMQMDEGLDTGPELARRVLPIGPSDTSQSLHDALSGLGGTLLREELPRLFAGELRAAPQPAEGVTLAPPIQKEEGELLFEKPAVVLERQVRAFTPWPGTFTSLGGALLKVHKVRAAAGHGRPGELLSVGPELEVACQEGSLVLLEVQPANGRRMPGRDFLSGRKLEKGSFPFQRVATGAPS
jgi:methionyl-tRNA formyltransferase